MKIILTRHAIEQIEDRKINFVWVQETVKFPDIMKKEDNKYYALKRLNGHVLKVVYVKEKYIKVITTFFVK